VQHPPKNKHLIKIGHLEGFKIYINL